MGRKLQRTYGMRKSKWMPREQVRLVNSLVLILVNLHKKAGISKLGIKSSYADF